MIHIPAYRFGKVYESLETHTLTGFLGGEPFAAVSQVNGGIVRRDLKKIAKAFGVLQARSTEEMIVLCREAGDRFLNDTLPLGDGATQSPDDYLRQIAATCGMPHVMGRANMRKIHSVFTEMPTILKGLTRGLDLAVLDEGMWEQDDLLMSFYAATQSLGVVLPSNSPGVNSLWLPAVALRIPVVLKPGREDPWTPWRIVQAFLAAGCPGEAFGFYPTDHEGSATVIDACGRVILFGDQSTVDRYAGQPQVSVHGPGFSKVLVGEDRIDDWPSLLDVLADSVVLNGGRSCVNASTIVVPRQGEAIARALAAKLAVHGPRPLDDDQATLAAFANPAVAEWTDQRLAEQLKIPGAVNCSEGDRRVELDGMSFLRPTIVYCRDASHPLAKTEFLLPYAAVVEMPQAEMLDWIGPTLVGSVISDDPAWRRECLACPTIDRLNLGVLSTPTVKWDQPHEGNLFEFLYRRRAIQQASEG